MCVVLAKGGYLPIKIFRHIRVGIDLQMLAQGKILLGTDNEIQKFCIVRQLVPVSTGTEPGTGVILTAQIFIAFLHRHEILPCANGIDPVILHALALQIVPGCDHGTKIVIVVGQIRYAIAILLQL